MPKELVKVIYKPGIGEGPELKRLPSPFDLEMPTGVPVEVAPKLAELLIERVHQVELYKEPASEVSEKTSDKTTKKKGKSSK